MPIEKTLTLCTSCHHGYFTDETHYCGVPRVLATKPLSIIMQLQDDVHYGFDLSDKPSRITFLCHTCGKSTTKARSVGKHLFCGLACLQRFKRGKSNSAFLNLKIIPA